MFRARPWPGSGVSDRFGRTDSKAVKSNVTICPYFPKIPLYQIAQGRYLPWSRQRLAVGLRRRSCRREPGVEDVS